MSNNSHDHPITRRLAASLFAAAVTLSTAAASFAADTVVRPTPRSAPARS